MEQEQLIPERMPELENRVVLLRELPENEELIGPRPAADLVDDIRLHGIIHPVVLKDEGNAGYHVYDGRRRIKASRLLHDEATEGNIHDESPFHRVRATVVKSDEPISPQRLTVILNHSAKPNVSTELEAIEEMLLHGYSEEEIATNLSLPVSSVRSILKLRGLVPDLREALDAGKISPSVAYAACRLSRPVQDRLAAILSDKGRLTGRDVHEERVAVQARASATLPFGQMASMGTAPESKGPPQPSEEGSRSATNGSGVSQNAANIARALTDRLELIQSKERGKTPRWTNPDVDKVRALIDEIERLA